MNMMRGALLALSLAWAVAGVVSGSAQSSVPASQVPQDDPFEYPETIIRAEGMREMTVMTADFSTIESQQPLRLIVRYPRGVDIDTAVQRLMVSPASSLISTASTADPSASTISDVKGIRVVKKLKKGGVRGILLELPSGLNKQDVEAALMTMQDVEEVEQEGIVTVQIASVDAVGGSNEVQPGLLRTGLAATSKSTTLVQATASTTSSVGVAVIDTGVDGHHPDINVVGGMDFTADNDFGLDGNGHGTHVAGIIGARNNGDGVVGAVPGTPIWSLKVLSAAGQGTTTGVIEALNWVTDYGREKGIRVINLSLSGPKSKLMCDAVRSVVSRGITVVAAAGNNGMEITTGSPSDCAQALIVTAMADYDGKPGGLKQPPTGPGAPGTKDDTAAGFSNYALVRSSRVVAAPGVHILSTVPQAQCARLKCAKNGPYARLSGTSMAAPLVSGMAILCYNSGSCTSQRASSAGALYSSFYAAARANKENGYAGDPNNPFPRKFYGYLAMNSF